MPLGFKAGVSSIAFDTRPLWWRSMRERAICPPGCPAHLAVHHSRWGGESHVSVEECSPSPAWCRYTPGTGSTYRRMHDYGWLSYGQHQDSLIWLKPPLSSGVLLVSHAGSCAANQSPVDRCPCQDAVAYARILNTVLAIVDQAVLSNQAWVPQHCCVCRKRVWGEQCSFSSRITGPALLEKKKNTTVSDSAPSTLSWQGMQRG